MAGSAVTANGTIMDIVQFSSTSCAPPHLAPGAACSLTWTGCLRIGEGRKRRRTPQLGASFSCSRWSL